jgi:perosamine synthetase
MKTKAKKSTLAIAGGPRAITKDDENIFRWPIVTKADENAVLSVLRRGAMSGSDVTKRFEREFADWMGMEFGLAYNNGTESLRAAMWACGLGAGDELICPSMTYWASCTAALGLGATVNFADILPNTLCIDPKDIEHRIGPRTKAIVVVHYSGYPCDMAPIMKLARKHKIKVIEDVSHAHGSIYKGKKVGTFGDISCMSMMAGKSFAIGEAGMMVTNDRDLYERCMAYGHYERTGLPSQYNPVERCIFNPALNKFAGLPLGGYKHRMNQTCSAMGRVQLKSYDRRINEIQSAMNRFWDLLDGVPGLRAHRPPAKSNSTMGGWYNARGLYRAKELGGLSCEKFCEAVRAEGVEVCNPGANGPLHLHPVFHDADLFNMGKPTMISFGQRDVRQGPGTLPASESINDICYGIPWFKLDRPSIIKSYAQAYRKVAEHADQLMD